MMARKVRRKTKRVLIKARKNKGKIFIGIMALVLVIFLLQFLLAGTTSAYEITKSDVFSLDEFKGKQISVFGARLGDTQKTVMDKIGKPDLANDYDNGISNWEYSGSMDMEYSGLILQFKSGILSRITMKQPFNKFLHEKTKIDHTKDEIYAMFGNPDSTRYVQYSESTGRAFRLMNYESMNMEIILLGDDQNGISFYL